MCSRLSDSLSDNAYIVAKNFIDEHRLNEHSLNDTYYVTAIADMLMAATEAPIKKYKVILPEKCVSAGVSCSGRRKWASPLPMNPNGAPQPARPLSLSLFLYLSLSIFQMNYRYIQVFLHTDM